MYAFSGNLTGVNLDGNEASWGGGVAVDGGQLVVASSTVVANTAEDGGGAYLMNEGSLRSNRSDWGTSSQDNDPDDVYLETSGTSYDDYRSSETFTCSDETGTCS